MIKANELRIGNYYYGCNDVINKVDALFIMSLSQFEVAKITPIDVNPIPLTPEILELLGFIDSGNSVDANWHYKFICIPTNHINITYELNLFTTDEDGKYGINLEEQYFGYCKSLHQLQNLYFVLTGEELNAKELTGTIKQ